jgi:diguanylate cyclase (GGDEF)-like protein/PAS domain S-box-containing protein
MALHKKSIIAILLLISGFIIIRYLNGYQIFYQISQLFFVFVGIMIFVITYFTFEHTQNRFLLSIGFGYLISAVYLIITVLQNGTLYANLVQENLYLWTFPRAIESVFIYSSLAFFKKEKERAMLIVSSIYTITIILIAIVLIYKFPEIDKLQTIMGLMTVLILSLITFKLQDFKDSLTSNSIYKFVALSFIFSIFAQIFMVASIQYGGLGCSIAILIQVASLLLLFHGVVIFGLDKPFRLMAERKKISNLKTKLEKDEELIKLYENVFTQANNGIVVTDNKNKIILVNPAFTKITEFSHDEVIGKKPNILKSGRQSRDFYNDMWKNLMENNRWDGEIWNRKKFGEVYPQWLSISVIRDIDGNIKNFISNFSDISIIKKSQKAIEYMAHHDNLTGLVNRVLLKSNLDNAVKSRKREANIGGLLYLDLDRFKYVNDTFGHGAGDVLLQFVAERLKKSVRSSDIVARVGGDEFIVLLTKVTIREDIKLVANKIIIELSRSFDDIVDNKKIYIGTSIGGVVFPEQSDNIEDIIKFADIAMFESKNSGRNSYTEYVQVRFVR